LCYNGPMLMAKFVILWSFGFILGTAFTLYVLSPSTVHAVIKETQQWIKTRFWRRR